MRIPMGQKQRRFWLFCNFPMVFLPTSIRVEDLKDPAQLLLRSAHHHRKLRLNRHYSFQSSFPSYHQHCDDIIVKITVMFSWKSMLPLLSSSNIPYTESHKMPPCVTTIIAIMFFYIINKILLHSNAQPPSRQRTASSRSLLWDISPWTWGDRLASFN